MKAKVQRARIEIAKETKNGILTFYYTGMVQDDPVLKDHIRIDTDRGEHLSFPREKVTEIKIIEGESEHGRESE